MVVNGAKIFVAIRSVFAYSEDSFAGSGAGGTLPNRQSGFTRKGLQLCGLWAFVSLPVTAALKGSKMRGRKAARVGKESFRWGPWCAKKQLAIGLVF